MIFSDTLLSMKITTIVLDSVGLGYLPDVAALEWAFDSSARAADGRGSPGAG